MPFFGVPIRNGLPIGLGSVAGFGVQQFDPSQLFEGGTVAGAWYDPSDLSTMFDTSAGTTPVAMPGQGSAVSVGLMLDKSQNGVGTNGSKRLNLLTYSEDFGNAAWQTFAGAAKVGSAVGIANPNGVASGVYEISFGATGGAISDASAVFQAVTNMTNGASHTGAIYVRAKSGTTTVRISVSTPTTGTSDTTVTDTAWTRISLTMTATSTNGNIAIRNNSAGNSANVYIWGADLRLASEASTPPTYQPITSSWYATEAGNHAIAINDTTARPELRARVNLLTYTEQFDNGAWTILDINAFGSGSVANTTATTDPLGGNTADFIQENTANASHGVYQSVTKQTSAIGYVYTVYLKQAGRSNIRLIIRGATTGGNGAYVDVSIDGQTIITSPTTFGSGWVAGAFSPQSAGNGWYKLSFAATSSTENAVVASVFMLSGANVTYTGDGTSGIYIWGADLRPANIGANVPAYQRIADANTYDTSGFPLYLRFDGIDDSMYTPANLNLSGTDKVAVFAGVRKLSDAATAALAELSVASDINNGAFGMFAPANSGANSFAFRSRGTVQASADPGVVAAAPVTRVQAGIADISAPVVTLRLNGTQAATNTATQGTGNYGTYPLYIGARNNASFRFNGHLHSLIIAGSAVSAGNISATEQWVAGKTGLQL